MKPRRTEKPWSHRRVGSRDLGRRILALILAGGSVAILGFFIFSESDERPSFPGRGADFADPKSTDARRAADPESSSAAQVELAPALEAPTAGEGEPAPSATARDSPSVLVLDRSTGDPIAGAHIGVVNLEAIAPPELVRLQLLGEGDSRELFSRGLELIADENGRADLPPFGGEFLVKASAADLRCEVRSVSAFVDDDQPRAWPLVLELVSCSSFVVSVVDADGRPAPGAPVVERVIAKSTVIDHGLQFADEHGRVSFEVPTASLRPNLKRRRHVAFAGPTAIPAMIPFPVGDPGDAIRVLELPPCGSVELEVVDADEHRIDLPIGATLGHRPAPFEGRTLPAVNLSRCSEDGRLVFPWVGLGLDLSVGARPLDESRPPFRTRFTGPRREGEVTRVELFTPDPLPMIAAVVFDREGAPLVHGRLRCRLRSLVPGEPSGRDDWREVATLRTDALGRLRGPLSELPTDGVLEFEFVCLGDASRRFGIRGPGLRMRSAGGKGGLRRDLGELRLETPPFVVSGRVSDERGRAVPGASVRVGEWDDDFDPEDAELVEMALVHDSVVLTDANGCFEIRGFGFSGRLFVVAARPGVGRAVSPGFPAGTPELACVLRE